MTSADFSTVLPEFVLAIYAMAALLFGEALLLAIAGPGIEDDAGTERLGQGLGAVGRPGIDEDDVVAQSARGFDRTADPVCLILGDDKNREGRHGSSSVPVVSRLKHGRDGAARQAKKPQSPREPWESSRVCRPGHVPRAAWGRNTVSIRFTMVASRWLVNLALPI